MHLSPCLYQPSQISAQEAQPGQISKYHRGGNGDICIQVGIPPSPVRLTSTIVKGSQSLLSASLGSLLVGL